MQALWKVSRPRVWFLAGIAFGCALAAPVPVQPKEAASPAGQSYRTELFGKQYRLDDNRGLAAYIQTLETTLEAARETKKERKAEKKAEKKARRAANQAENASNRTEQVSDVTGQASDEDSSPQKKPANKSANDLKKSMRRAIQETYDAAVELAAATGPQRTQLLQDVYTMAGALRASTMRILPRDMDVFAALANEKKLWHSPVGLGNRGIATDLAKTGTDPAQCDPVQPSSYWVRPRNIAGEDLYYGFGRTQLPGLDGEVCTYTGPKTGFGVHAGFDISCEKYKKAKIKFGKQYSQPFAQRIFWALGFHTVPADHLSYVKVKWDRRILTEYNSRKDEHFAIKLFGLFPVHIEHRQRYLDPFAALSEVIMRDANGNEISVKPHPNWDAFKKQLYKKPHGRPETLPGNFNAAFADRIEYLIYRDVDFQLKDDTEEPDEISLGDWDWSGEGNPGLRETRGAVLIAAWLNDFDPGFDNNRLTMLNKNGERVFKHYIYDVGVCLGRADDARKMQEQLPNEFPWSFTRPAKPGQSAIPLDGSYHPIQENKAFEAADIYDARWIAPYLAQLTQKQLLEALVGSGMPSALVHLYYDKLATRRNKALDDLGFHYAPLPLLDSSRQFDYDPKRDGLVTITTSHNEQVTAPDDGWVVVKGKVYPRTDTGAATLTASRGNK